MGQNEEQSGYEEHIRARITDMLGQAFHLQQFRVSVDARMNFDQVHRVSEKLIAQGEDGNGLLVRKHSSRTPAPAAAPGAGASEGAVQDEFEYAHGSEREEVSSAPGKVERLSVAVMVPPTLSAPEIERLKKLVTAAAGLDSERGDRLEIGSIEVGAADGVQEGNTVLNPDGPSVLPAKPIVEESKKFGGIGLIGMWLAIAGIIGLLAGWAIGGLRRREPARLRHEEREQVVLRLRSWLAEGEVVQ
jgi:flagellar M-ring protein FliF